MDKSNLVETFQLLLKKFAYCHRQIEKNVFIIAMPRGGSTWLLELVSSQPGFRYISEPLNLRNPRVKTHLSFERWHELYNQNTEEVVHKYLTDLAANRVTFMNPVLSSRFYRPFSRRTVFKLIHGAEDQIEWMINNLNGKAIVLLRHPLAVSTSRKLLPRLQAFIESDYSRFFSQKQISFARKIQSKGTFLEKAIVSWCFQNSIPLRCNNPNVFVVTYEQMVVESEVVVKYLAEWLELPNSNKILKQISVPSTMANLSFSSSSKAIKDGDLQEVVGKWRKKVSKEEERQAFAILEAFGIDAYTAGELTSKKYWLS